MVRHLPRKQNEDWKKTKGLSFKKSLVRRSSHSATAEKSPVVCALPIITRSIIHVNTARYKLFDSAWSWRWMDGFHSGVDGYLINDGHVRGSQCTLCVCVFFFASFIAVSHGALSSLGWGWEVWSQQQSDLGSLAFFLEVLLFSHAA